MIKYIEVDITQDHIEMATSEYNKGPVTLCLYNLGYHVEVSVPSTTLIHKRKFYYCRHDYKLRKFITKFINGKNVTPSKFILEFVTTCN